MSITANASPSEVSSPFYKVNKEFAKKFEVYVSDLGGEVTGKYNAWSYHLKGKIHHPQPWVLQYKKATITSQGNLLLSSEYQSLLVLSKWMTVLKSGPGSEFLIRRKKKRDLLFRIFDRSLSTLNISENYVIRSSGENQLISVLTEILTAQFQSKEIYRIEHKKNRLEIEMRTRKHHFTAFEKVMEAVENHS